MIYAEPTPISNSKLNELSSDGFSPAINNCRLFIRDSTIFFRLSNSGVV